MRAAGAPGATTQPAAPAASVAFDRPPPGLERGKAPAPSWLIVVLGVLALLIVVGFYARKAAVKRPR